MLKKISIDDGVNMLAHGKPQDTYYIVLDKEYAFHGNSPQKKYNINVMNRMHISRLPLIVPGGCVVMQEGDIIIYHYSTEKDNFFINWWNFLSAKLHECNIDAQLGHELTELHHDMLVHNKDDKYFKFGTHSENLAWPGLYFSCCGIMLHVNIRHIRQITSVSGVKYPRGLSAWGVKTEDIETWFLEFMQKKYGLKPYK